MPEVIDVRRFPARAFVPLLEVESRLWNEDLRWDYGASADLISACLEDKRLSGYALVADNQIHGYSFFFYEDDKGLIGNLFVDPRDDGRAQARRLLDHVLETMLATPGIRRVEAQLPHYTLSDLAPSFEARGFRTFQRLFMAAPLERWAPAKTPADHVPPAPGDFALISWERRHDREAAELLYLTYHGHVDAAINDHYQTREGSLRLIENIVRHRGCGDNLPQASQVAVYRPTRQLAGILAITHVRKGTAHIPQIAVAAEFQGRGLGSTMIERAFRDLAARGYQEISLTVTESNAGAVRLYQRLGFETFRTFGAFVWDRRAG